jgi:hypothetical protein
MRTTLDLDETVLRELKQLQRKEKKSLGRLVSDLLAAALRERAPHGKPARPFVWISQPMGARVDLGDREAVLDLLDRDDHETRKDRR